MHIKSIYDDKELDAVATLKNFLTVRQEGSRQVNRNLEYYNLDMIIAVGYRVNSKRATEFLTALSCRQKLEPVNSKVTLASEFIYTRFPSAARIQFRICLFLRFQETNRSVSERVAQAEEKLR